MPYAGAFSAHAQQILVPRVDLVEKSLDLVLERLSGRESGAPGDFSFILFPLPKIALNYIFYRADEDFPPSVTCLYSQNADVFMPVDGLADVGEYMSKTILDLIGSNR
jgi:hypothetical protein